MCAWCCWQWNGHLHRRPQNEKVSQYHLVSKPVSSWFRVLISWSLNVTYKYRDLDWPFGDSGCMLSSLVAVLNMFASAFLLTVISLDRCLSTWVVVWAWTKRTVLKARIICLLIWLAAVACTLPYVIFRKMLCISPQQTVCILDF